MLGHLARDYVFTSFLLSLLVLASLLFLNGLQAHPFFVAVSLTLISHLLFNFFPSVKLAHMGNFLSLLDFFLHKPFVHGFASILILVPLNFSHIK